jgi:hypothetical protein
MASLNIEQIQNFANQNDVKFNKFNKVSNNEVLEELSNVIFNLDIGEISKIVETPLAKHIVIISKIYPEHQNTLEKSFEEISNTLKEVQTDGFILDLKNRISQQILDGYSLNEIANDNSLIVKSIKNTGRQINQIENDIIKSEVISNGFAINKDFVSDIIDIKENVSIIINVDNIEDEKPYQLEEVFEEVSSDWLISLKIKSIGDKIEEVSKNSNSIDFMSNFVDAKNTNVDLKLDNMDYPSILKNNVFKNKINQLDLSVVNEDVYVSKLNKISFSDNIDNARFTSLQSELKANFEGEKIKNKNISTNG